MPNYSLDEINSRIKSDPEMTRLAQDDPTEFKTRASEIYDEFGYHPDGTPMPTARKAIRAGSRALGISPDIGEAVAATPIPLATTAIGARLGAVGGVKGGLVGASMGSVVGEMANSALGITEPMSKGDVAMAAGAPLLGPGLGRLGPAAIKVGKRIVPGMGAGLNEYAGEQLVGMLKNMRVTSEDVQLFRKQLDKVPDFEIPVPKLKALLEGQSSDTAVLVQRGIKSQKDYEGRLASVLQSNPDIHAGRMNSKNLMDLEHGFNLDKGNFPEELWGKASGTIITEMEDALANPTLSARTKGKISETVGKYKDFIAINNKYRADESITKAMRVDGSILKSVKNDPDMVSFDRNAFKKFINNDPHFTKAFSEQERTAMADAVKDLGYLSKPPSASVDAVNLAKRYGPGGMIGWMLGGPTGAIAGAGVEEGIRSIVSSEAGRKAVKYLATKNRGRVDALEVTQLSGQIAAGMAGGAIPGLTGRAGGGFMPMENQE